MSEAQVAVVGAGAWGTALAALLAKAGKDVTLWSFEPLMMTSAEAAPSPVSMPAAATSCVSASSLVGSPREASS